MDNVSTREPQPLTTTHHAGSCHCGAVRFEATLELRAGGPSKCNCSICSKLGAIGAVLAPGDFRLLAGEDSLSQYIWGSRTSTRYFCRRCGVHCFARGHLPELGGDYVAINVNALDDVDPNALELVHWDGRHDNWQAGARPTPWPIQVAPQS
jgi:hypothetical protein